METGVILPCVVCILRDKHHVMLTIGQYVINWSYWSWEGAWVGVDPWLQ